MTRVWPAMPLFLILVSIGIAGSGLWMGNLPALRQSLILAAEVREDAEASQPPEEQPFDAWTEDQVRNFGVGILERSGFSPERQAFSRTIMANEVNEPEYQPRLLGISGNGKTASALIEWKPGQTATSVRVGDATPWGRVASIGTGLVVFVQGDIERSIELFAR
jgi:hypothetical protein